jgi:hypothetical protein
MENDSSKSREKNGGVAGVWGERTIRCEGWRESQSGSECPWDRYRRRRVISWEDVVKWQVVGSDSNLLWF